MKTASLILTAGVILLVARCRDQSIASYRVRREKPVPGAPHVETTPPATTPAPERPAGPALATASGPGLTWTAPAHWVGKPLSAMRKGSYTVPGDGAEADLSITAFPGAVGGELANLNRWRGQLQLPPVTAETMASAVRRERHDNLEFIIVDLTAPGENPAGMLGAMVSVGDATWFFKLSGPASLLAREKPAFESFLATVRAAP